MSDTSDTPLSDLIAAYIASGSSGSRAQFLDEFRRSQVGVIAIGAPAGTAGEFVSTADRPVSVGFSRHAAGRPMVLAFADPEAFAARFGWKFNAGMAGAAVLATALLNPECAGVLVNSALAEVSVVIDRATAESLLRPAGERPPSPGGDSRRSAAAAAPGGRRRRRRRRAAPAKPWWRF